MASLATRSTSLQPREGIDQNGPVIKKRVAVPSTRSAFGDQTNAQLQRQKATTNLRKPFSSHSVNVTQKSLSTHQKELTKNLKKLTTKDVEVSKPPVESEKNFGSEAMLIGTPSKDALKEENEKENIFDLKLKPEIKDIDEGDVDNPQLCSEFVNDIYQYMLYLESVYPIQPDYLKETNLKSRMRCILVDWLIQVHHRFQLLQETLYLTIAVLDRFLQVHPVPRTKLQLAGVTAMLVASKYEEMYAPEVNDFVYITDKAFTSSQILHMEVLMLKTLNFNLGRPLPLHFLRRNSKAGQVDALQHALAKYLMELSLIDYEMCHVPPSKLAAAALCLSLELLGDEKWGVTLQHYSTYSKDDLQPVICYLAKNLKSAESSTYQQAVNSKYSPSGHRRLLNSLRRPVLFLCKILGQGRRPGMSQLRF